MNTNTPHSSQRARWSRRSGQILVLFAGSLVVIFIMCAYAVDTGLIVTSQTQLRNAVDAAALAGAAYLTGFVDETHEEAARAAAVDVASLNIVHTQWLTLDPDVDVTFGRYYETDGNAWVFKPKSQFTEGEYVDSMRVVGRRNDSAPDGPVPLFFSGMFGQDAEVFLTQMAAVATQPRRYVIFVMDRSGSMTYDIPDSDIDYKYSPNGDGSMDKSPTGWYWMPRQIYSRYSYYYGYWATAWFYAVDDDTGQVTTSFLPDHIKSHLDGGIYFRYMDRDDIYTVQSGWLKAPDNVTIYSRWGNESLDWSAQAYGPINSCDYGMATGPIEPLASSQDAAIAFLGLLRHDRDQAGLATYGYNATLDSGLTSDWTGLAEKVASYDPRGATAMPKGMEVGITEMIDHGTGYGQRIMILLTDGNANYYNGSYLIENSYPQNVTFMGETVSTKVQQTIANAVQTQVLRAIDEGIRIYTISFGDGADQGLMRKIAAHTDGAFYYADEAGSLTDIFIDIFHNLPVMLTL